MKKSVLMGALLICIAPSVFGQKKSAYETKKIAIENKYLQQMGVPLSDITQLRKKGDFFINALFAEKLSLYGKNKGTAQQMALVSKMADELKAAEKLKTTAEIKAEKDKKQQVEEKKEIEIEEKLKKDAHINKIKTEIKEEFIEWAKKGEFETTDEYKKRIQDEGKEKLKEFSSNIIYRILSSKYGYDIKLGTYNADESIYPITISKSFTVLGKYREISIEYNAKIEKENALMLKDNLERNDGYGFSRDIVNWILKDGYLFPISIEYFDFDKWEKKELFLNKGNYPLLSELLLNTNELGLSEYFSENYTFLLDREIIEESLKYRIIR